jgi:hypothetical protein
MILQFFETLCVILLVFAKGTDFQNLFLGVYFIGALITFYLFHVSSPFYHTFVSKYWSFFSAVNLWTAILVIMAKLTEVKIFHGIIYAWIIGIPLLLLIVIWSPE